MYMYIQVYNICMYNYRIQLLLGDVGSVARGDGPEGVLYLLRALHILRLLADHEGHVLLQ